ncbi:MAG: BBP7 family outer membrane beta-barrel protein [Pirellulaceae bacterium]
MDRDVNPNLLPPETTPFVGAERPRFSFRETDYWLQGGNVGLEYRW